MTCKGQMPGCDYGNEMPKSRAHVPPADDPMPGCTCDLGDGSYCPVYAWLERHPEAD